MLGRVTNEQFRMLFGDYNKEQKNLKEKTPQTVEKIEKLQVSHNLAGLFLYST